MQRVERYMSHVGKSRFETDVSAETCHFLQSAQDIAGKIGSIAVNFDMNDGDGRCHFAQSASANRFVTHVKRALSPIAKPNDLSFELDSGFFPNGFLNVANHLGDLRGRCSPRIDDEVRVFFANLGATHGKTF